MSKKRKPSTEHEVDRSTDLEAWAIATTIHFLLAI